MEKLAPVTGAARLHVVDVVRGVAILGILIVNMRLFFGPIYLNFLGQTWFDDSLSLALEKTVVGFAQGKFYTIFSTLFGFGLAIQYERFQARERPFPGFWVRRMLVLLAIGLIHALVVWYGDILAWYALGGLILLLFRDAKPKTLKIWAVILLVAPLMLIGACTGLIGAVSTLPEVAEEMDRSFAQQREIVENRLEVAEERYPVAGFGETMALNARQWLQVLSGIIFLLPNVVGMFLIGLLFARHRVFHDSEALLPRIRSALRGLFPVAVLANGMAVHLYGSFDTLVPSGRSFVYMLLTSVGQLAGCMTYIFLIVVAFHSPRMHRLVAPIGAVGRMALTNYLTHSIVFTTLANGYGVGLYGKISPFVGLLMTFGIFVIQIWLSNVWLARFRFGPMEWLWRSLTYGRLQPMKRSA
jgi:uncharacterized protein